MYPPLTLPSGEKIARKTKNPKSRHAIVQPEDESIRYIALTQGQVAIVDAADYDWLNEINWNASWSIGTKSFYAKCLVILPNGKQTTTSMHRIILGLCSDDDLLGDHKEPSQTLDNRRSNLRIATYSQNLQNRRVSSRSQSGLKAVRLDARDGKWYMRMKFQGKAYSAGSFDSKELAHQAYVRTATRLYGEFARAA